ncbi:hypothetical protein DQQ10_10430 [Pseudochryseolinea flava]|uniref:Uncharacterized protein n=1 Tax=Pseudochryseolinea flava TaxID=2059302 RepID=A0A364Y4R3_9BACT|nr:hypothetical protein DQQ10_10430 [Pseudochryseolinea flava]
MFSGIPRRCQRRRLEHGARSLVSQQLFVLNHFKFQRVTQILLADRTNRDTFVTLNIYGFSGYIFEKQRF